MRFPKLFLTAFAILSVLSVVIVTSGCESKRDYGALLGAGAGALLGSQAGKGKGQLLAVAIGTLGGAFLGSEIGKSMDEVDRMKAQGAIQKTAVSGKDSVWRNPDTGNFGTVKSAGNYYNTSDGQCREFRSDIWIEGKKETLVGTACQRHDGTWRISF